MDSKLTCTPISVLLELDPNQILMLNNGVPVIFGSRMLGHAQPSITLDVYGHLIPTMQEQVAEIMD